MPHVTALSGVRSTPRFVEVETPRSRSKLQCEVGETGVLPLGKEPCMFFPRAVQWGIWLSDTTCHQVCMPTKITVAVTAFRGHLCGGTGHSDRCPSEKCVCSQSHQCGNLLKLAPVPSGSMLMMRLLWWTSILCLVCTPTHILGHIPYPLVCLWRAKNKSSTQVCFLKPEFQHSVAANTSRYASQAGKCRDLARTIFAGLSLYTEGATGQLLHSPLEPLKLPLCPRGPSIQWRKFPGQRKFSFTSPSKGLRSNPNSSSAPLSLCSTQWHGAISWSFVVWDVLKAFSRYSVRTLPHAIVYLMYLWEWASFTSLYSAILISLPTFLVLILLV